MDIVIVELTPSQASMLAAEIVSIYRDSWLATYPNQEFNITKEDLEPRFIDFKALVDEWRETILSQNNRKIWVAQEGEKYVGFCIGKKESEQNELEYIYLSPRYEGKGIGKALMSHALGWLGSEKPIVLYGAGYNAKAISFYTKFGFHLSDERIPEKELPNGKKIPSMKMMRVF